MFRSILHFVVLFFGEGVIGASCSRPIDISLYNIWHLGQTVSWNHPTSVNIGPGVLQERPTLVWGYPPRGSENMSETKNATAGDIQATGSNMGAWIWNFVVFRAIVFDVSPHHPWDWFVIFIYLVWGSGLTLFLWFVWICMAPSVGVRFCRVRGSEKCSYK